MKTDGEILEDNVIQPAELLPDHPSDQDEFESGGHVRSAKALAASLAQLKDRDGAIGLDGKWGAGKSTVIRLANEALKEVDEGENIHHIFSFDLWAHQSDDFRRAFLEELIDWLDRDHLTVRQAKDFRDKIRDRTKTIKYDVDRAYSWTGAIFILAAPLFPLVLAWLSPFAFSSTVSETFGSSAFAAALTALGALYVLLFARVAYLRLCSNEEDHKESFPDALSAALGVFTRDEETRTEEQSIREEDPTTLEFQKLFRSILSTVQKSGKRLVLVFDNIDRLPPAKVVEVWAEMRSVFSQSSVSSTGAHATVTAVVPYDSDLIAEAFDQSQRTTGSDGSQSTSQGRDLLAKTFNLTIRVSPPLSLDWRKFLDLKIDRAFEHGISEDTKWRLYRMLDLYCQDNEMFPTPRMIITFVNSIGSLWNQWGREIPIESMGLYILFGRAVEAVPDALTGDVPIDQKFLQVAQQREWKRHFAAIQFNVSTEISYQVLAGGDVKRALEREEKKRLEALAEQEFFEDVLVGVLTESAGDWVREGLKGLAPVVRGLEHVNRDGEAFKNAWGLLINATVSLDQFDVQEEDDCESLATLVSHASNSSVRRFSQILISKANDGLPKKDERNRLHGKYWAEFFDKILAKSPKPNRAWISKANYVPAGAEFNLGVAIMCAKCRHLDYDSLRLLEKPETLADKLVQSAAEHPTDLAIIATSKVEFFTDECRVGCVDAIATSLRSSDCSLELLEGSIGALVRIRATATSRTNIKSSISGLLGDGTLVWYFDKAWSEGRMQLAGQILFLISEHVDVGTTPPRVTNHGVFGDLNSAYSTLESVHELDEFPEELVVEISKEVIAANEFTEWAKRALADKVDGIYQAIFRNIVVLGGYDEVALDHTVVNYPKFHEILGDDSAHLLNELGHWGESIKDDFALERILDVPLLLLEHIEKFGVSELKIFSSLLREYFGGLDTESWGDLFREKEPGLTLLIYLIQKQEFIPPTGAYRSSLKGFMLDIACGDIKPPPFEISWDALVDGLPNATKEKYFDDLLIDLGRMPLPEGISSLVEAFPTVTRQIPFTNHADIAIDHIFVPLVFSADVSNDEFLSDTSEQVRKCLALASKEVQLRLLDAIGVLERSEETEKVEWAKGLRKRFDLPDEDNDAQSVEPDSGKPVAD